MAKILDLSGTAPEDGQTLGYDAATLKWRPVDPPDSGTSGALTVVSGSVTLDNGLPAGTLVGYRATASTTFTGQGGSVALAAGAYIFERVTGGWTYRTIDEGTGLTTAPPETTPPVAGSLAVTDVTHNSATLTVSGASDAGAGLHGSPYAFSTNGGTTWTGWQTANVYAASGLTPSTSYQFRHKVRDAQGNEATGTAVTQSTTAAPVVWTELFTDTFTAADGTNIVGRSPAAGYTWAADNAMLQYLAGTGGTIVGNKAVSTTGQRAHVINVGANKVRVSFDYVVTTTAGATVRVAIATKTPSGGGGFYGFNFNADLNGTASVNRGLGNTTESVATASDGPKWSGSVVMEYDGTTLKVSRDGVQFVNTSLPGRDGTYVGFGFSQHTGSSIDNFKVETLP